MHLKDERSLIGGDFSRNGKGILDILFCQNGNPGRDATDERQRDCSAGCGGFVGFGNRDGGTVLIEELQGTRLGCIAFEQPARF